MQKNKSLGQRIRTTLTRTTLTVGLVAAVAGSAFGGIMGRSIYNTSVMPAQVAVIEAGYPELAESARYVFVRGSEELGSEDGRLIKVFVDGESHFYDVIDGKLFEVSEVEQSINCYGGGFFGGGGCFPGYYLTGESELEPKR